MAIEAVPPFESLLAGTPDATGIEYSCIRIGSLRTVAREARETPATGMHAGRSACVAASRRTRPQLPCPGCTDSLPPTDEQSDRQRKPHGSWASRADRKHRRACAPIGKAPWDAAATRARTAPTIAHFGCAQWAAGLHYPRRDTRCAGWPSFPARGRYRRPSGIWRSRAAAGNRVEA